MATAPRAALAQDEMAPQWIEVFVLHVKQDRVGEFEALAKQMSMAQAKAGEPAAQIWEVTAGQEAGYHIVFPFESFAALESATPPLEPGELATWIERINGTIDTSKHFFARIVAQKEPAGEGPFNVTFLRTVKVNSGKQDEFMDWLEKDFSPVWEKTGMGGTISQGSLGDSPQNFYFASGVANMAEFDKPDPLIEQLGEKGMQKLLDKLDGILAENKITLLRPRPDLMASE